MKGLEGLQTNGDGQCADPQAVQPQRGVSRDARPCVWCQGTGRLLVYPPTASGETAPCDKCNPGTACDEMQRLAADLRVHTLAHRTGSLRINISEAVLVERAIAERNRLLRALKAAVCFGCGERFGEASPGGCVTCRPARSAIAEVEGAP